MRIIQALYRLAGSRCHVCAAPVGHGALLCCECAGMLPRREAGYCPGCGEVYADAAAEPYLCGDCRRSPMPWDSFQFHGPYEGLLGELVRDYKFNGRLGLGRLLSSLLEDLLSHSGLTGAELLAPVPLHPRRLAQRGFNQSLELARPLAAKLGARLAPGALTRIRHTVPQTRLTGRRRRANLKGAFEADRELVAGRKVLLLDDIMTTGGTLMECARTLKRARAEEVAVLVLARTGREP